MTVLILFSISLIRSIVHPLSRTTQAMVLFSKGKLDGLDLPQEHRTDEIGQLMEAFHRMAENNREVVQMAGTLADGHYHIDIKPRSDDDVMSNALIGMTRSLREFSRQLEQRSEDLERMVEKRTRELQNTVLELEENVSIRKETENALRKSEDRLRTLFDSSTDAIFSLDNEQEITSVNRAFQTLFGYTGDEVISKSTRILHRNEASFTELEKKFFPAVNRDGQWRGEWELQRKDGMPLPVEIGISLIGGAARGDDAYVSITRDISDRKLAEAEKTKLEDQLRQAQKMEAIGALAGGIAHDFNNILFPVIGYAEMMRDDVPDGSPLEEQINEIITGALRASELVKQILAFSRQADQELKPIGIQFVLNEMLKLIRSTIPSNITIVREIQKDCGLVMADPTSIHQVAMNLVTNAFHAMEETGGTLTVGLKNVDYTPDHLPDPKLLPGAYVCLTIADTGGGMDPATMERIFDPYFTTKEIHKGTGLGLSVVHGIVKSYKGEVIPKCDPGKGTSFAVYIPRIASGKEIDIDIRKADLQFGNERVLLVDDEEPIARMVHLMLDRLGYRVTSFNRSTDALEAFRNAPDLFDLVITDMMMPHLTGDKLATEVKQIRPEIPIILCTGFSEKITNGRTPSVAADKVLMKPIVRGELANAVRKLLDRNERTAM